MSATAPWQECESSDRTADQERRGLTERGASSSSSGCPRRLGSAYGPNTRARNRRRSSATRAVMAARYPFAGAEGMQAVREWGIPFGEQARSPMVYFVPRPESPEARALQAFLTTAPWSPSWRAASRAAPRMLSDGDGPPFSKMQPQPRRAASIAAMSIFCISIIASNARLATAGSGSVTAWVRAIGVICQDNPHLSLHQPQALSWPPLPTIAFQ